MTHEQGHPRLSESVACNCVFYEFRMPKCDFVSFPRIDCAPPTKWLTHQWNPTQGATDPNLLQSELHNRTSD